ncbi:hypothetical protein [Metamycoplasma hominis]|uniref:hypothetical protein n=1 Tax=Metamycoplasma hominis TaxID=2098 RepID=UPI0015889346|nr:hypothetical protein [Metamycoplasma hominis]QKX38373.1 hypothetical protein HU156_01730 [Metamycoplasma hominis]
MKKSKLRILLSTSLIIALATTATLVATSLKSKFKRRQYEQEDNINKLKEKFNRSKSKLDNLIKSNEAKDVDKQAETDIFNNTNLTDKDLIKDIESKTKTIEDAIESLTKKINDKKNQKDNLLKDFNDAKKQLEDLINSQDGQKVDTSKANQSLQNNNVDASSTTDQIINATTEIKKATQDLQKLIDAAKEKAKQYFDSKKQQLDNLIKSNEAKDVDKQPETDIFNNTNLTSKDLIKDIESKTKTIEDAIKSLTKKINDKKENLLKDFNEAKKQLEDLINSQDGQKVDTSKANQSLQNNNVDASSTTDQIINATTEIKKATQDLQKLIDAAKEKATQDFNSKKQQLDDLIKSNEAKDVDKQPETDIFNNTNLTGNDLIKDIESKTKTIEDAIESLTKKINDKKENLLKDFTDAKKKLQDLINSQDAQKVDKSNANQSLKNNNVDTSSTTDQIVNATNEIKKATQDLQKLIDAAKEKAKQDFDSKKQQLDNLIKSNEAKDVDKQEETNIFNNTNLTGNDLIKDIESKTKTIEDAIESLTKKINDKKDDLLKDFNDAKKKLEDLINSQDGQKVDTSKANQSLQNNNVDASSTTDQIVNATNEIKKATQDLQKLIDAAKDKATQDFNSKKQQLDNLIKSNEAKDVDKQEETNIFNSTNLTGNDLIKDIESKTKTIEDAIESLTKKINDKKNQKDNLLKDFNDAKKQLEDLINSQDGQKVDTSKANQSLQNNNVDASLTVDQIINATTEIKKATQDLQKLIDAAKDKATQDFNSKKQQLDDLIKSNEAKDVDKQSETNIFDNTNLTNKDLIKDIESKTKTIEDAIKSLTKKINDKKPKENIEYDGLEKIREQIKQFIEKVKEDEYYKEHNSKYYDYEKIIDHLNQQLMILENVTSDSDIQQISGAKQWLTKDLKNAKEDKFSCDMYCFVNLEVSKFIGDMQNKSLTCLDSKKYWEEAEKEISKIREDAIDLWKQEPQEDKLEKFKSDFRALKKPIEDKMDEILDEFFDFWNKLSNTKSNTSSFIEKNLKGKVEYKEGYEALNKLIQEAEKILDNPGEHSNLELKNKEAEIQDKLHEYKNKYNMNK